ncbi:tail fiber protein [Escherichia coli FRIK920]|nr:tail fiber protein [Escherichia coli FRIK920]
MDVEYGQYSVILLVEGFPPSHAGTITVYEDSQPGTLNDFLGAMSEDDVRPEALRRFELMVEEAARHAEEAKKNAGEAETSARNAGISASQAEESAANADTSAGDASESARQAAESAAAAKQSEEASSSSASAAAQKASESLQSATDAELSKKTAESAAGNAARDATTAAEKARESAESAQSAEQSRIAAEEAVNRIPTVVGLPGQRGNRSPRVLRGRREIKESVETPALSGQPVNGDRKEKQVRLARWGQPDLRDRRATRGRHKYGSVWGRETLLRQTAMAGSRVQMVRSSPD